MDALENIGEIFSEARRSLGFTIDKVSDDLKIRRKHISAIENGDISALPDRDIYVSGIIKNYGLYLQSCNPAIQFDTNELIHQYKGAIETSLPSNNFNFPVNALAAKKPRSYKKIGVTLTFAAFILLYVNYNNQVNNYISEQYSAISHRFSSIETNNQAVETQPEQQAETESNSNTLSSKVSKVGSYLKDIKQSTEDNFNEITQKNSDLVQKNTPPSQEQKPAKPVISSSSDKAVNRHPVQNTTASSNKLENTKKSPRIVLMAKDDTWIKISNKAGDFNIRKNLKSGDAYFLPERKNLLISAGNAQAVEVFMDGEEHSFLGTLEDIHKKRQ